MNKKEYQLFREWVEACKPDIDRFVDVRNRIVDVLGIFGIEEAENRKTKVLKQIEGELVRKYQRINR